MAPMHIRSSKSQMQTDCRSMKASIRTLIVDNYDSYTFNLYQYASVQGGPLPVVIRNDQFSWEFVRDHILPHVDNVIISPGPGSPDRPEDFGINSQLLLHSTIPVLGVCLGHQGLALVYGGKVVHANEPVHGRLSQVFHHDTLASPGLAKSIFDGVPSPFSVVRYHSLVVSPADLPECIVPIAWSSSCPGSDPDRRDIIMALQHREKPLWGLQFHPESICTSFGQTLLDNFRDLTFEYLKRQGVSFPRPEPHSSLSEFTAIPGPLCPGIESRRPSNIKIAVKKLAQTWCDCETVFSDMFSDEPVCYWLDSAKVEKNRSRFTFMGAGGGPLSFTAQYSTLTREVTLTHLGSIPNKKEVVSLARTVHEDFFAWLTDRMQHLGMGPDMSDRLVTEPTDLSMDQIPFDFHGGLVGYFGYEMKTESMHVAASCDSTNHVGEASRRFQTVSAQSVPDASFMFADRILVFDHEQRDIYCIHVRDVGNQENENWLEVCSQRLAGLQERSQSRQRDHLGQPHPDAKRIRFDPNAPGRNNQLKLAQSREQYLQSIQDSLVAIRDGETYEVCLTTQMKAQLPPPSPSQIMDFYLHLRRRNPAPYAAFIRFGEDLTVTSSSPELFLKVERDGWVKMKPIKGTVARVYPGSNGMTEAEAHLEDERRKQNLESNEKDRAENLMIVDLIRNDLNTISRPRTVHVPALMQIESYATVHQLVSTVKGHLRPDLTCIDAIKQSFPPGSMTGAPKRRTVEILEGLEGNMPRGVYSGCLGWIGLNGSAEMNVVIRTAVFAGGEVSIGAGGAIVALSDPEGEYDEMLLKSNSVAPSLAAVFGIAPPKHS
ncbi:ADC synthase [Polychytrium aggregatum]|uniref:ADC synthase n=1 Tax=Polychytrium aggregatum TaxID=110093 RepID=UPI0022FED179|nr:ADC synthase [Polychytrium aggregatum]KAI9202730.1 ADC synthase [Polychytrium aggregatum]